jgi:hypothetical protein
LFTLRQDNHAQRFNSTPETRKIGGIIDHHRRCGCFVSQTLQRHPRPSSFEHRQHLVPFHPFMLNQYERLTVPTDHSSEAHGAPVSAVSRYSIPDIAQTAP